MTEKELARASEIISKEYDHHQNPPFIVILNRCQPTGLAPVGSGLSLFIAQYLRSYRFSIIVEAQYNSIGYLDIGCAIDTIRGVLKPRIHLNSTIDDPGWRCRNRLIRSGGLLVWEFG